MLREEYLERLRPWAPQVGESGSSDLTEPFTAVEVDLDWGDVTLRREGDLCRVESDWTGTDYAVNAWAENGVLRVEGRQKSGLHLDLNRVQSAGVVITVPEGAALDRVEVSADLGTLWLENVAGEELNLEAGLGDVTVRDGSFTGGTVVCEGGEVVLSGALRGTWEVRNELGGITFGSTCAGWEYDLEVDLGEIVLNGADRGTLAEGGGGPNRLTAYSDLGDIVADFG